MVCSGVHLCRGISPVLRLAKTGLGLTFALDHFSGGGRTWALVTALIRCPHGEMFNFGEYGVASDIFAASYETRGLTKVFSQATTAERPAGVSPKETRPWRSIQVMDYARQLLEAHGNRAIAEAAQKAFALEQQGELEQAKTWRRIEAALKLMSGPHAS